MSWYRSSLTVWLKELQSSVEVESMNALLAKSVATTPESFQAFLIRDSQIMIEQMRTKSRQLIDGLDYFIDQIPIIHNDLKLMKSHFAQTKSQIQAIVWTCGRKIHNFSPNHKKLLDSVWRNCEQTNKLIDFFTDKKSVNNSQLESTLRKLKENFGELIDYSIRTKCEVIAGAVTKRSGMLSIRWSLLSICSLSQNDAYMCRIFIEFHNMVKPLIEIVNNYSSNSVTVETRIKAIALRVLTVFSINREAVKQLINECIYSQFLTTLIRNESSDLITKEAVALIVQLTKPLIDANDTTFGTSFHIFPKLIINDFIYCLTQLIQIRTNRKIFLLSCAAIANISFIDIESLIKNQTLNLILDNSIDAISIEDIFIRDQIITILANICRKYPLEIVSSGGLVFIISSLQLKAENCKNSEELMALERIQQKVSVAIARLATNDSVTQVFFRLNVVNRLIQLCKEPKERNFSEFVRIACIAALKRLAISANAVQDITAHKTIEHNVI